MTSTQSTTSRGAIRHFLRVTLLATFLVAGLGLGLRVWGQTSKTLLAQPTVDQRVELLSIVARMAGFAEYNDSAYLGYVTAIHAHFDPYKGHPVILLARQIRDSMGLGYDALMSMAVNLRPPPDLAPLVPFSDSVPSTRWGKEFALRFSALLKQFYVDAHCKEFFEQEQPVYAQALGKYNAIFDLLDVDWYKNYYGLAPKTSFHVVLGMGNGGGNYGPKTIYPDGHEDAYAIEGVWADSTGFPTFPKQEYLPVLIHEFNHSFVNYLSDLNKKALQTAGERIFDSVQRVMQLQAYSGWQTMENEALVRASVVRYLISHPQTDIDPQLETFHQTIFHGFFWTRQLVALLGNYEAARTTYPSLESFMPRIIQFYDTVSADIAVLQQGARQYGIDNSAHVTGIGPFQPGDTTVPATLRNITFSFDTPLVPGRFAFGPGKLGMDHYTKPLNVVFGPDHKTVTIQVELKPGTLYQIRTGSLFRAEDGYPVQPYLLTFKTAP